MPKTSLRASKAHRQMIRGGNMSLATLSTVILRKVRLGTLLIGLVILSTPALAHLPDIANGQMPTLAPLVREVTPSVVNISVHGRIKEENPLYRDPVDVPKQLEREFQVAHCRRDMTPFMRSA